MEKPAGSLLAGIILTPYKKIRLNKQTDSDPGITTTNLHICLYYWDFMPDQHKVLASCEVELKLFAALYISNIYFQTLESVACP